MRKLLILYFVFYTVLLFSQNSLQSGIELNRNYPIFIKENSYAFSERKLIILDRNYSKTNENYWMIDPSLNKDLEPSPKFSSLLLKKQLEALNHTTPFALSHNPTLERFIRIYLKDRRESISKLMDRANYYFPIFEEFLDKYNLPLEIKYLAVIESALKPNAISRSGAKGLWQFMLTTGKQFDLQVNSYVDERYDPIKSTEAACKYISSLYGMFHDWDLALAAYNSGPGNVRKAIKRAGGKRNYWEIRQFLPQETRGYLPAFYATFYIFEYAQTHKLQATKSELTYFEIDTIHVKKQLSFATIQKNIPIKKELLVALNPQYKREIIPYSNKEKYVLTLPQSLINNFIENENAIYLNTSKQFTYSNRINITKANSYVVKEGDNLNKIATKFHITIEQLKKWNGLQTDYLIAQQRLVITDKTMLTNLQAQKIFTITSKVSDTNQNTFPKNNTFEIYIVKEGDTLFNISRKFTKTTIDQIKSWNNIENIKYLKPGTELKIFKS